MASVVAMNVFGTVITTSPGCTPAATSAKRNASVPLPTPTQCDVPQNFANAVSNCCTISPPMKPAVSSARRNTATSSLSSVRCGLTRSRNGIPLLIFIAYSQRIYNVSQYSGRVTGNNAIGGHIFGHHTSGAYDGVFANCDIRKD